MANRRMFARTITGSGRFLRLSHLAMLLYFALGMEADDDGFAEAFGQLQMVRIPEEYLKELEEKGFVTVLDWEDLVVHIDGWNENNQIRRDRYTPSRYLEKYPQYAPEKSEPAPEQQSPVQEPEQREVQNEDTLLVDQRLTQYSIGKVSIGKDSIVQDSEEEIRKEKNNLIQNNINQDKKGKARASDSEAAPAQSTHSSESERNNQEKPGYTPVSSKNSQEIDDFHSDFHNAAELEQEFNKKRQKSMDLLMNSKYFSNSGADSP